MKPAPLRQSWALPAGGWVATFGAVLAVCIGIGYDVAGREPGRFAAVLILGGIGLITGAPWLLLGLWTGQMRRWALSHDSREEDKPPP